MDTGGYKKVGPPQVGTMSIHSSGLVVTDVDSQLNDPDNCADMYLIFLSSNSNTQHWLCESRGRRWGKVFFLIFFKKSNQLYLLCYHTLLMYCG